MENAKTISAIFMIIAILMVNFYWGVWVNRRGNKSA